MTPEEESQLRACIVVAVKETLEERLRPVLEGLEEMQRIVSALRNSTQKESLNEISITREYIQ